MSDVLAAVLRQDIDFAALPADAPAQVRRLIARCLDRDLKTRLRDIGEARIEIARTEAGAKDAIFWQRADGTGPAERLTKPEKDTGHVPASWSPTVSAA